MLEKFLISIGLKQPEYVEDLVPENTRTVRPSSENRFENEDYSGDLKIHQPKDEVEIKVLRSFNDSHLIGPPIKEGYIVAVDIRDISDQGIRQRIVDFIVREVKPRKIIDGELDFIYSELEELLNN